jgi:hypothetical protein
MYVESRRGKEKLYAICGAEIQGIDARDLPVERCSECKRLFEEETGLPAILLDPGEGRN